MVSSIYYNPATVVTKQRFLSFIIGARGAGKTYGFKKHVIRQAIKYPEEKKFVYLRRYITEVDAIIDWYGTLRSDPDLVGYEFDQKGRELRYAEKTENGEEPEWKTMGMIYALTEQRKIKSQEYPGYYNLVFDEWLAEGATDFIKNEPQQFMNLIDSIFRNNDFQVFCLANATMLHNSYFSYFDLYPNLSKEFTYDNDRNMLIQMIPNDDFKEYRSTTPMGRLSQGTNYFDYAFDNQFKDDDDSLVESRSNRASNVAILKLDSDKYIGIWEDDSSIFWFSEKFNSECPNKYSLDPQQVDEQFKPASVFYKSLLYRKMITAREWGDIRFDSKKAKGKSATVVKAMGIFR